MPPAQDKWERYAEPATGADKWEQYAEKSTSTPPVSDTLAKTTGIGPGPGFFERKLNEIKSGFSAAGSGKGIPPQPTALGNAAELTGVLGQEASFLGSAPGAIKAGVPALVMNATGRGMSALGGAAAGNRLARDVGLPGWMGKAVGGATGFLAPELISKFSGPIISKIATLLGKSVPEVATVIAQDSTLAQRVGRDVVERAARGEALSPKEEELLFDQVQKHYTPEVGVESSAKRAGKIYAGRGTNLRPTNEQLALQRRTGLTPPPEPTPVTTGGSGESGASAEAISRTAVERRAGVKYFIEDTRTKSRIPVSSVDVNSGLRVGPGKRIIRSGPEGEFEF